MPRCSFPVAVLAAVAAVPAVAALPDEGIAFSHQRWQLACDNTGTCRAAGYGVEDMEGSSRVSVLLTRLAGAGQPVTGAVRFADWEEDDPAPAPPVRLRIDGRDAGTVALPVSTPSMQREPLADLSAPQVAALLVSLRGRATIEFIDARGQRWQLSGDGASAVLLKMDEFQGRLGTPGALVRKGHAGESQVPAARPAPRIHPAAIAPPRAGDAARASDPALRSALLTSLGVDQACVGLGPGDDEAPLQVTRLSADRLLVSTECWRGAYNAGSGYWVIGERAPFAPETVTLDAVDHADGRIHAWQKGRGLGDCIWTAEWVWDGRHFVQASDATTGMCEGIAAGGPWSLPTRVAEVVGD